MRPKPSASRNPESVSLALTADIAYLIRRGFVEKVKRGDGSEWMQITPQGREAITAGPLQ